TPLRRSCQCSSYVQRELLHQCIGLALDQRLAQLGQPAGELHLRRDQYGGARRAGAVRRQIAEARLDVGDHAGTDAPVAPFALQPPAFARALQPRPADEVEAHRPELHADAPLVPAVLQRLQLLQPRQAAGGARYVVQQGAYLCRRRGDLHAMLEPPGVSPSPRSSARRVNTPAISRLYCDEPRKSSSGSTSSATSSVASRTAAALTRCPSIACSTAAARIGVGPAAPKATRTPRQIPSSRTARAATATVA